MINKFNDYEQTQAYSDNVTLPRGGYICKIIGAKLIETNYGQSVKVALDIAEGDYAGYFQKKYDNNQNEDKKWSCSYLLSVPKDDGSEKDGWTKRRFKTFTDALESSNDGYHFDWDERKFKGKLIGVVFNWRQYDFNGTVGFSPNAATVTTVEKIRNGNFKIPNDKLLDNTPTTTHVQEDEGDIPF